MDGADMTRMRKGRPIWAYVLGSISLLVLAGDVYLMVDLVWTANQPGGGDAWLILVFIAPVLLGVAGAMAALFFLAVKARTGSQVKGGRQGP
jgi:hypothetical protein